MKAILKLVNKLRRWHERGCLLEERAQIAYWGRYADFRTPRIDARLAELDRIDAAERGEPYSVTEVAAPKWEERHPALAEEVRRLRAMEDGEVVA